MRGRDTVLQSVQNIPKDARISIRTDLPVRLKIKRHELAQQATKMRKEDNSMQVKIKESIPKSDVWMEVRRKLGGNSYSKWEKYS